MKNILSLLSVLTISGTAVPTTIAASPYPRQTQENKLENSEINYKQTDNKAISSQLQNNNYSWWNIVYDLWEIGIRKSEEVKDFLLEKIEDIKNGLENLSINDLLKLFENKKQWSFYNLFDKNISFPKYQSPPLFISNDKDVKEYFKNLFNIINYLQEMNIIRRIRGQLNENGNPILSGVNENGNPNERFFLNPDTQYDYFIIPIILEQNETSIKIEMIFRSTDLYVQGFILNNNYYYFNDNDNLNNIPNSNYNNVSLEMGGSYISLNRHANFNDNTRISWTNIINSFFQLSNINPDIEENNQQQIADSLIRVILATAESIRFIEVQNLIINNINNYWMNFTPIINNWSRMTTNAISYIENSSLLNFPNLNDILVFTSLISDYFWQCNTKPRISSDEYCYENNLYINNVEYGDYFQNSYFDKKRFLI